MTFFEYVNSMKELGTPVATAAILLLCLFLVVIIIKMLSGARRGTFRQLLRSGTTLVAAVISYATAVIISNSIIGGTDMQSIEDFIVFMDNNIPGTGDILRQALSSFDPTAFEYIIILPATIILLPILATLIFLLINLLLHIVRAVITKVFGFKKGKSIKQRLGGALLGGVEAIIWVIMVSLPVTGLIGLADSACTDAIESGEGDSTQLVGVYEEYIKPFSQSPVYEFIDSLGSGEMADGIATISLGGVKTNLREEISSVVHIGIVEIPALEGADFGALTEANKQSLDNIIGALDSSPFLSTIVAGAVQSSSGFMSSDLIPFDKEGEYAGMFDGILTFLKGVTSDTLSGDLNTIKSVYYAISDSGVIKALEGGKADIMTLLEQMRREGDDTISKIIAILRANDRTAPLIKAMTEALLSSLSTNIELPDGSTVTVSYESVKEGMSKVLLVEKDDYQTDAEYIEALAEELDGALRDNGIEIEDEIINSMAEYIDIHYSALDELSDEQFNDLLLHYYDAYLEYVG